MYRIFPVCKVAVVFVLALARPSLSQVPNHPLWPQFVQQLSSWTGRTAQDINTLGLSDPTINQIWTSYSASMPSMSAQTIPQTTPPPMPDLYQTSYSFSSSDAANQLSQPATSTSTQSGGGGTTDMYAALLNMVNQQPASTNTATSYQSTQTGITSPQDALQAYSQLSGAGSTGQTSYDPMQQLMAGSTGGTTGTTSTADMSSMITMIQNMLATGTGGTGSTGDTGGTGGTGGTGTTTTTTTQQQPQQTSYQALVDQYNTIMNPSASTSPSTSMNSVSTTGTSSSFDQLLQQYSQLMGPSGGTQTSPTAAPSSTAGSDPMTQLMQQMMAAQMGGTGTSTQTTATNTAPSTPQQSSYEQQLATLFPGLFQATTSTGGSTNTGATASAPSTSATNTTNPGTSSASTGSTSSTAATQAIFDALLFGGGAGAATGAGTATGTTATNQTSTQTAPKPTPTPTQPPTSGFQAGHSIFNQLANMVSQPQSAGGMLGAHVSSVMKARASRELGCRFLQELLEVDVVAHSLPILSCMNSCPAPLYKAQQFGLYCLCCPPWVNDQAVSTMSLMRGHSYMESPLHVMS